MEFLLLLLIVILLILVMSLKNTVSGKLQALEMRLVELSRLFMAIREEQKKTEQGAASTPSEKASETIPHTTLPPIREAVKRTENEIVKEPTSVPTPRPKEVIKKEEAPSARMAAATAAPTPVDKKVQTPAPKKPGFFERNPDLEKFIGENLANKIGIAILVIGIGFFVKYAIDKEWINEIGRVFIGILSGGLLIVVAHRMRKTFTAFSSVLVGGGIAVQYFTITIAFHEYHIFPQTVAFAIMVVITAFTVMLSLGYNRVELAVLAILGGFGSPFMVSTGEGNYVVLFTYLLILNSGMLVLAYHKKWRIVNIVCYVFTILIFGGWLSSRFDRDNTSMIAGSLVFASLFYLIFFAMNIINNLKQRTKFEAAEITMLLSNTFLYFSAGMFILHTDTGTDFRGLFTASLGVFNFVFAYALYKNTRADRNLVFMLIGLVLTFISLAAPIQLEGNYITLFWAAETVLLLWLSQKSGIKLMAVASVIVMALMVVSLLMDWRNIYLAPDYSNHLMVLLNKGYITGVAAIVSIVLTRWLLQNEKADSILRPNDYRFITTGATFVFLYLVHVLELRYQLTYYFDSVATQTVIIGTYNMLFIVFVLFAGTRVSLPQTVKRMLPLPGFFAMASYLSVYHHAIVECRDEYVIGESGIIGFLFHYALIALMIVVSAITLQLINKDKSFAQEIRNAHWWIFIFLFVFVASAELDHTVLLLGHADAESIDHLISQNQKIGYPILWGLSSFLLIAIGLNKKIKTLRIISMVLLLITLLKLFLFDLADISEGGRIAAFISLGVLLLVVSFMYQRLKKLLLDDSLPEEKPLP